MMDINHQLDQMQAMLRDFAPVLHGYYKDLIKEGFSEQQAFALVVQYQKTTFTAPGK